MCLNPPENKIKPSMPKKLLMSKGTFFWFICIVISMNTASKFEPNPSTFDKLESGKCLIAVASSSKSESSLMGPSTRAILRTDRRTIQCTIWCQRCPKDNFFDFFFEMCR
jgi:hypothetical protein